MNHIFSTVYLNFHLNSRSGGELPYVSCVDGCRYSSDNNINITFPKFMFKNQIIPLGETVSSTILNTCRISLPSQALE